MQWGGGQLGLNVAKAMRHRYREGLSPSQTRAFPSSPLPTVVLQHVVFAAPPLCRSVLNPQNEHTR